VTKVEKENLDLFTQTVADWVMTSRSSLEYLKTLPINGKDPRFMRKSLTKTRDVFEEYRPIDE